MFLYTDGASRGNPGESGGGFVLIDNHGRELCFGYSYYDIKTNNESEYLALIDGLNMIISYLSHHDYDNNIVIRMDSLLIVKQINGEYRCKAHNLIAYFTIAKRLINSITNEITFEHIRRIYNNRADFLANNAVDFKCNERVSF